VKNLKLLMSVGVFALSSSVFATLPQYTCGGLWFTPVSHFNAEELVSGLKLDQGQAAALEGFKKGFWIERSSSEDSQVTTLVEANEANGYGYEEYKTTNSVLHIYESTNHGNWEDWDNRLGKKVLSVTGVTCTTTFAHHE